MDLIPASIICPYCGEHLHISIDPCEYEEFEINAYIEDCQVCCQPITIKVSRDAEGNWIADAAHANETL